MGNCMNKKGIGERLTLAILGLDNAGKTVTTKGLQGESLDGVAPTIGFTNVDFKFNNYDITMFDLGGGKRIRDIWKDYFAEIYGVVYVVDSSEQHRIDECRTVLVNLLENPLIQGKPMLLLANKQDVSGALDEMDICEYLDLEVLVNKYKTPCRVEPCSATLGQGKKLDKSIRNGMSWLVDMITKDWGKLKERVTKDVENMKEKQAKERKEKLERVKKIRDEREKREKEERLARGEAEKSESDDERIMADGDPFKRVNMQELEEKEKRLKEKKRQQKEQKGHNMNGTSQNEEEHLSVNKTRNRQELNGKGIGDYGDGSHLSTGTHVIATPRSRNSLPPIDSTSLDHSAYSQLHRSPPHALNRLGQYDSPRPNRKTYRTEEISPDASDEENKGLSSSLEKPSWAKNSSGLYGGDVSTQNSNRLPSLGQKPKEDGDMQPWKGSLSPLGPLKPLQELEPDYDALEKKKKKKKAKKNQTVPELTEGSAVASEHSWPGVPTRASRSPRLHTVQEPDDESDAGMSSFSQKYNLLDELPEMPSTRSQKSRKGPNTDYEDLIT